MSARSSRDDSVQPTKAEIQFIEVDGCRIAFRTEGDEAGLPVILIHALASSFSTWDAISAHLAKEGFRVIAFDLPGHGRSDWRKHYSLSSMEDCLVWAFDQLGVDRFHLVGHSLGGHLALRLAARLPKRVRRVVVEAAPVPPRDEPDAEAMMRESAKPSLWRSAKMLGFGRLIRLALLRQFDFRLARPVLSELKKPAPQWWSSLRNIQSPCLLLASPSDGVNSSRAHLMAESMCAAHLQWVGEGHHLHKNHQDAFLEVVMPFLSVPDLDGAHSLEQVVCG
jgi:pimeloyl-ACP methyl ester carboxylesterase